MNDKLIALKEEVLRVLARGHAKEDVYYAISRAFDRHEAEQGEVGLREEIKKVCQETISPPLPEVLMEVLIDRLSKLFPHPTSGKEEPLEELAKRKGYDVLIRLDSPMGGNRYDLMDSEAREYLNGLEDKGGKS